MLTADKTDCLFIIGTAYPRFDGLNKKASVSKIVLRIYYSLHPTWNK